MGKLPYGRAGTRLWSLRLLSRPRLLLLSKMRLERDREALLDRRLADLLLRLLLVELLLALDLLLLLVLLSSPILSPQDEPGCPLAPQYPSKGFQQWDNLPRISVLRNASNDEGSQPSRRTILQGARCIYHFWQR